MAQIWGLAAPLPVDLSLMLLGFLVYCAWKLFSRYQNQGQVAAKKEMSKQHDIKQIQKLTDSQLKKAGTMNIIEADLTCISGLSMSWSQEYVYWAIDRSLEQILQHLENARSTLMKMRLQESQDLSSFSISDMTGNRSSDSSMSSVSVSSDSSNPVFPGGATWQFQSHSFPAFSRKKTPAPRSQGSSLPSFQKTDLKKFVLNESPGPLGWGPLQRSPLVRGELERHMSHKVSTLGAQVVPLPVKKSREILNHLMDVQGVPEQGLPKTQLPTLLPQRAEQNTNRSPDAPSFHVHVNIGVNSELSRTEVSQPLTSNKQLQSANDRQVLSYNPVVISVGNPAPINIVREENALLKKDPRHALELNIDQRVLGLPEKRIQPQRAPATDVELTAQVPRSATDRIKVTPVALLQVMGLMGLIPESHAQVIDCVGFPPQPPNQAKTVNLTPQPSDQVIEPKTSLQHSATESKSMASRLSPVTDNTKVTPEKLLRIMDSTGLINELYPHVIEPAEIAPKPQYQVMESAKVDTLHGHQAIRPEDKSLGLQQSVLGTVDVIPQPQHKVMETPNTTLGPQNQATEHIGIAPGPIQENILEISSSALPKAIDYTKATPVAQQTMDFMEKTPPGQPHITEPRALIQTENLTPLPAQPDVLTSTVPRGAAESRGIPPQLPSTVLASSGVILLPSGQSLHALKVTPIVQAPPGVGMIPPLQVVEPPGLTPQPVAQVKEPLDLPSGFQVQAGDSVGMTPQHQGAECVSLTPGRSQQVMDPSKFTPRHQKVMDSTNLPSELQNVKSEHLIPDPRLRNMKSVDIAMDLVPEKVEYGPPISRAVSTDLTLELHPLTMQFEELTHMPQLQSEESVPSAPESQLQDVKSGQVNPDPSYQFLEPAELALRHQGPEERVGSDVCHQVEESVELPQSSLGMRLIPLRQTSDSMEMYSPPLQETLETRKQVVKEMEETPESQNAIKDALDLLPESEVQNMNSAVMAPEPQPSDGKFLHGTLESCSEVTGSSEITLRSEYEDREPIRLTFPKVDDTQGGMIEPHSETGSLELGLEPGVQGEKSESLAQHLQSVEVIGEPPVLAVEPIALTTGPKPHIKDVIPGPQLQVKLRQMDTESQLQNEESVNVTRQSSLGEVGPEKTKPESGPQSPSPKELIEETQPPKVKSVHLNLGPQQLSIKSGLIPGPQLQSVRFPMFYQGGKRGNFISGPPRYGVKSDKAPSRSPVPEIRSSDYSPGPNLPEAKLQHVKPVEGNVGPCFQAVKFSDLTPEPKHQGFRCTQVIPGIHFQDRKSQGLLPESFLPLSQEPQVEDRKLVLPMEVSEFHSRKHTIPASELQYPSVICEEVNPELRQQDTKFSECASSLTLQGVKFGEQTPGPLFHSMHPMTPELGIHNPKLAKMTPELNDTKQVSFNSGPCLQNVKFFDGTSGTQSQGVTTSELHSGAQLECVKMFEFTTQPERQGMKPELIIQETLFKDRAYVTRNQAPSFEDEMSYKLPSEPQIPTAESVRLTPGIQLASVDHSELVGRPEAQGIESSESIPGQHLGHIKPVEKVTVSKQEEFTPGPHLGDVKSMELRSKSEQGKIKAILFTTGKQAGDKEPEELPPGPSLKGLKSELLPSRPQLENRKSAVLTLGQCPERIKATVVSPCSSQSDGTKTVKLIPSSTIQDLKTVGLARDTHVQDVNAMGLKLEPKQEESPVTFRPGIQFQDEFMEVLQVPQLQGIKPKELTAQSQMRGRKHGIISCLKPQSLKPVNIAKTRGIPGVKLVNLVSTKPCRGMAPTDLTLKPGQDDQITVRSPEWKGRVLDQLSKHFESENVLSMKSGQEAKPADKKPKEIKFKVQFKDTPSFESTPKPVVHSVKPEEAQDEPQVPSMKPCQVTPGPQEHQVKVSEPMLEPPFQDVKTMVLTEPHTRSTKSVQWIPISEFQSEKWVGSDLRLQSQSAKPTELKPSTEWRGVRPSALTVRSKIQEEKSVGLHLEPQSQQVKTSPLALGLQKTKTLNLTSEPQPQGIKTVDQNKDPPVGSVRSVQWIPGPEFHSVKCLELNRGSQSQGVKSTEQKTSTQLGGVKPSETTVRPKLQEEKSVGFNLESQVHHTKTPELFPEPEIQKGENVTSNSEPQPQGIKTVDQNQDPSVLSVRSVQWIPGPEFHSVKCLGLNRGSQSQGVKSTEQKTSIQLGGVKPSETTVRPKLQEEKSVGFNLESQVHHTKTPELFPEPEIQKGENITSNSEPQPQGIKTVDQNQDPSVLSVRSVQWIPGPEFHSVKCLGLNRGSQSQGVKSTEQKTSIQLGGVKRPETTVRPKLQGNKSADFNLKPKVQHIKNPEASPKPELQEGENSEPQAECVKSVALHHGSEPQAECVKSVALHHGLQLENTKSVQWIPASGYQAKKSMLNLRLQSEDVTAKELNPLAQLRNVKTSNELTTGLKLQSKQPTGSTPEQRSHGFKTTDFKPKLQFRSMKGCDPNLRSKINNIKFTFEPKFHLEVTGSPGLNPGMQPQEVTLGSPPGTQPQSATSLVFKQESQASEANCGVLSQRAQPQSSMELKSAKSSELALQTKPWDIKSEINSGPQWQSAECSDLTPETESQNMKCITSSQGKPFAIRSVQLDSKHGSQWQGIKSNPGLRTKSQEMEMEDCKSGPQLQDLKSSRIIMGIKVQDVISMGFTPGPQLQGMPSEVLTEKRVHGVKLVESKPSSKLQGKKPDFTPRKMFLGTKSVELDSVPPLQDLKYSEQILGMKLQDVNSMEHHVTSIKSPELETQIKSQGIKAMDFNSGSQPQNKKLFELAHGKKLQSMESLIVESKSPNGESVELNLGPQLHDEKSKAILGIKQEDARSTEVSSSPCLQGMRSSEVFSEDMLQGEKPKGFVAQSLWQDAKSLRRTSGKALDRKLLQLKIPQFQDGKGSVLTPELHLQGMEPEAVKPGSKLKGMQPEPTNVQAVKDMGTNHGAELQVVGFAEQDSDSTIYSVVPSELSARNLEQDGKFHKLSQKQQLQSIKPVVFNHEPYLQHIQSSEVCTKLPDQKPMEFNSEQQVRERKAPDVCTESKLSNESSLEFKSRLQSRTFCDLSPGPQIHCKNIMTSNTGTQNVESPKLHPDLDLQGIKSKEFCLGSHLEDVNSACTPDANSQYTNSSEYKPGSYLQNTNFSAHIPEPDPRCINSVCNPGPHFNGMNSVCILGPKLQCVDSTVCNHEPNLQDVNSSVCTSMSSPPSVNSSGCTPEPSPPCVNSSGCTPEPSPPCMNSTECNSKARFQGVNSSACIPSQNPQCEHSNRNNLGPLLQGMHSGTTFPAPQIMCVNSVWCSVQTHLQNVNSSACTRRQESQSANSMGYNPGPHLEAPKLQGMKFPEVNPGTGIQREMLITVNPGQHLQDLRLELTPGSNIVGIAPAEYNPGPQEQCVNFSELNPGLELQRINLAKLGSGPQLQNIKSFAWTPGSESQNTRSVRLSPGPPFQGVKPSNLSVGAKCQEIPFLKKQFGSRQQTAQPMLTPKPQSTGVDSVEVLPTPLPEDKMFPEMSKQPLLCTNSVNLTPGYGLQDLRSKEFSPGPCFQTVMCLKPGSQSQSGNSSEFAPCHGSQCAQSFFAPKPCLQDLKPMELRLGSQQQSMNRQQIALDETPMVVTQESTRKSLAGPALTSVKFSNLIPESQSRCMKFKPLNQTSELRGQSVKHVKLSSVSLPRSGNSVGLSPSPFLQNVTFGNQIPQTNDQITEPSKVTCRPAHHLVNYAEMNTKIRYQAPKLVNYIPLPVYQEDAGSSEMMKGLGHKSTETTEKSMRLTPKPTHTVTESLGMPQQPELQVPGFADLTPTLSDQDSNASELTPQKNYQSLETLAQFPALGKPESPLGILYSREDPVSREPSNISQSDSQTRTSESHRSPEASYFSQTETELSEQLKDLQVKIAAKLLRSQIPHNVPPPPESGLVLKYPFCLQCGQWSGFGCSHKSAFPNYVLVYPQIHLIKTPEGRGEIRLQPGFRLHIGKRPQVSKYHGRNRAETSKNPSSSSHRKAKIYTPASKSPTSTRDFQSRSSQSPASVPVHRRQKQWGSRGVAGKTEAKDSGHSEFCEVLSTSESGSESNRHEKWAKSRLRKTSDLKYPMKKITKELKTQNIKLYKNSRPTEECPSGTLTDPSRSKSIKTAQTSTVSSKRKLKKSSQPRFIQQPFQRLKQAFQRAHRVMAIIRKKPKDRASPDNLWSSKNLYPEEKDEDDCLTGDGRGASTPVIKQWFMGFTPKKEDRLQETCDQAQQSKQVSSLQPRPLELAKNIVSERNVIIQATSILQPLSRVLNVNSRTKKNYEFFSPESKNCSKVGAKFQAQETVMPDSFLKRTMQSHFKHEQHRTYHSLSERSHGRCHSPQRKPRNPSDRTLRSLSERRCSPSQRKDRSPSRRTPQSISDRSRPRLSKERGRSPSGRSQPSPSGRRPRSSSGSSTSSSPRERRGHNPSPKGQLGLYGRNQHSPPFQRCCSPSKRSHLSPIQRTRASPSEQSHGTLSERPPSRCYRSPSRARLHRPSSGLHCSHSQRTHYSPSDSRCGHSERRMTLPQGEAPAQLP